ncbi:hypothetical protein SLE2022_226290 [Rubroshorea leprosula]
MAYRFRERNYIIDPQQLSFDNSDEETANDSRHFDPDYKRPRRQRRPRLKPVRRAASLTGETGLTEVGEGSYSSVNANSVQRRRPGRPPKRGVIVEQNLERNVRRRRRSSFSRRPVNREPANKMTIFSWMISRGVVELNQKVWFFDYRNEARLLEGRIKHGGILCNCCNEEVTAWEFEAHAFRGSNGLRLLQPYYNIFLPKTQNHLLHCMLLSWLKPEEVARQEPYSFRPLTGATDRNDDACIICADGGDLICCERCPSTFHFPCMGMKAIPKGDWLCPFCVCKYCENGGGELLDCTHCEKKYHWECFMVRKELDLNCKDCSSFCGSDCREVYGELQAMVGVSKDVGNGISWTLLQKRDVPDYICLDEGLHITEINSKIAVAWSLLNEIFVTNMDRHTSINILESVVYNRKSNLTRVNFGGFYVAVLEKKGQIISAATIRVHGRSLAEMPFIGTQEGYRKQGMSCKLLDRIESTLCSLNIPNLLIPSVPELVDMWTHKHFFAPMEDDFMKELRNVNVLAFPSTVRLRKKLHPKEASVNQEGNASVPALPDLNLDPSEEMDE